MPSLSENPHLTGLLKAKNLEIDPSLVTCVTVGDQRILSVGGIVPEGTVVGFCFKEGDVNITAVIYDESKEGQDDALTTVQCII